MWALGSDEASTLSACHQPCPPAVVGLNGAQSSPRMSMTLDASGTTYRRPLRRSTRGRITPFQRPCVARLRGTGDGSTLFAMLWAGCSLRSECCTVVLPVEQFAAKGKQCLIRLTQPRGPPHPARISRRQFSLSLNPEWNNDSQTVLGKRMISSPREHDMRGEPP